MKGIEQGRAEMAYAYAKEALESQSANRVRKGSSDYYKSKNYKSYVKKVPMWIKTNGLGATLAFILSKRKKDEGAGSQNTPKNAYDLIYSQLTEWLTEKSVVTQNLLNGELSESVISLKSHDYRTVTGEVLALSAWLRRYAEGLIEGEDENDE